MTALARPAAPALLARSGSRSARVRGLLVRAAPTLARAAATLLAYAVVARLLTWSAFEPGWMHNHEQTAPFARVETYRRAFAAHDWLPIWSPFDQHGHGSPLPLVYHRLFSFVAGLLALVVGAYRATKLAVFGFTIVGALGVHRAARTLGVDRPLCFAAGALFLSSPYVLTDWMRRGALAEFCAMMLVPWLVDVALRLARRERVGVRLAVTLAMLFHAHSVICFFALPLVIVAALVAVASAPPGARARALLGVYSAAGVVAAIFAVTVLPFVAAIHLVEPTLSFDVLTAYDPRDAYLPLSRYLADPHPWGDTWIGLSIEVGRALLPLVGVLGVAALGLRARVLTPPIVALLAFLTFCVWLQHPSANLFYAAVPGALLLQFPWRLLVFIVPTLALLAALFAQAILRAGGSTGAGRGALPVALRGVIAIAFAGALAFQGFVAVGAQRVCVERYPEPFLRATLEGVGFEGTSFSEYLPHNVVAPPARALVTLHGCRPAAGVALPALSHFGPTDLRLEAPADCTVELSPFCSSFVEVTVSRGGVGCASDGTFLVTIPAGEPVTLHLERRGLLGLVVAELKRRRG